MSARRVSALEAIATIAQGLAEEANRVLFVGGTVTALYPLEDVSDVRPTEDVDCVVDVATTAAYYAFMDGLRSKGFTLCTDEGALFGGRAGRPDRARRTGGQGGLRRRRSGALRR
jgi:hypothetical protein